jgi:proline iminopeptidase
VDDNGVVMVDPQAEPFDHGWLAVGDGHSLYWELCGRPGGKPAVVLHGGPGSGCTPWNRSWFDLDRYQVVLFDQRNCGRSTPHASLPAVDFSTNTTAYLVGDIELVREHLGIDRWLVAGISWGTTLGLAYAQAHPSRVTEMVLNSVVTTTRGEVDWITRQMGRVFPQQWEQFRDQAQLDDSDDNLSSAYSRLLHSPDAEIRDQAARAWCAWEDTHVATYPGHSPSPRYQDAAFRLCFARIVTHYFSNAAFLADDSLLIGMERLTGIPAVLIQGQLDISAPPDIAWTLHQLWPDSELQLLDNEGHGASLKATRDATDRFATVE